MLLPWFTLRCQRFYSPCLLCHLRKCQQTCSSINCEIQTSYSTLCVSCQPSGLLWIKVIQLFVFVVKCSHQRSSMMINWGQKQMNHGEQQASHISRFVPPEKQKYSFCRWDVNSVIIFIAKSFMQQVNWYHNAIFFLKKLTHFIFRAILEKFFKI